jgi:hypothetical protein
LIRHADEFLQCRSIPVPVRPFPEDFDHIAGQVQVYSQEPLISVPGIDDVVDPVAYFHEVVLGGALLLRVAGVPLDIRLTFTNRKFSRESLERLLSWDFDKLIIAHGPCIGKDAKDFIEEAFWWLKREVGGFRIWVYRFIS